MMMIGIINWSGKDNEERDKRESGESGVVALTQPNTFPSYLSFQPKTTTNNILNPKDASNIHSQQRHYHIGFPHHWESPLAALAHTCFS